MVCSSHDGDIYFQFLWRGYVRLYQFLRTSLGSDESSKIDSKRSSSIHEEPEGLGGVFQFNPAIPAARSSNRTDECMPLQLHHVSPYSEDE
jgi:hypothetical protein